MRLRPESVQLAAAICAFALATAAPAGAVELCVQAVEEFDDDGDPRFRLMGTARPAYRVEYHVDLTIGEEGNFMTCGLGSMGGWEPEPVELGACGAGYEPGLKVKAEVTFATAPELTMETFDDPAIPLGRMEGSWTVTAETAVEGRPLGPPLCKVFP